VDEMFTDDFFRMVFGLALFGIAFGGGFFLLVYILASHPSDD